MPAVQFLLKPNSHSMVVFIPRPSPLFEPPTIEGEEKKPREIKMRSITIHTMIFVMSESMAIMSSKITLKQMRIWY